MSSQIDPLDMEHSEWFGKFLLQSAVKKKKNRASSLDSSRVPTRPGKPGKMRVHLENLEISWNFEKFNKYHGKMT